MLATPPAPWQSGASSGEESKFPATIVLCRFVVEPLKRMPPATALPMTPLVFWLVLLLTVTCSRVLAAGPS